jgi:CheY-like chemotaxis protein
VLLAGAPGALGQADAFNIRMPGCRVLVVDDDATTRELLGEIFDHAQAVVATAETAASAYDAVRSNPPDIIIADIGLPGEDGCSLLRRIRALPPPAGTVPAIALSAYTRAQDRDAARAAGFTAFIGKPADPQDLLAAVRSLLNGGSDG